MNATPPKFGTAPIEEGDDLFDLKEYTCVDCKHPFQTSRHSARCAMCRSLRQGQVGPATVTCPVCELEHKVPVLAPHRLCSACASDLDATERHIRETLSTAEQALCNTVDAWDAAYNQADPEDRARYHNVCDARVWPGDAEYKASFARKYARALGKGDGLSALLRAKEACDAATEAVQSRLAAWAERALAEVEAAR